MKNIIKVAFNLPLYGTYSYLTTDEQQNIKPGIRIKVPFGKKKLIGLCIDTTKNTKSKNLKYKLKYLDAIIDEKPVITRELLKLGIWASNYYQYPLGQVLFSYLPAKVKVGNNIIIH